MSFNSLGNCTRCGKLIVRSVRNVCNDCYKEVEEEFQKVYTFIKNKENRKSTIPEVSEATGVSEKQIQEFVREGRISTADFPNLAYPCSHCGENLIIQGTVCEPCRKRLTEEIRQTFAEEQEKWAKQEKGKGIGYFSLQDRNKNH